MLRISVGILLAALCAAGAQGDQVTFQAGIQKEVVDGDLPGAIKLYEAVAQSSDRPLAAKALVRIGRCYEKSGDARAAKVYERVVQEFADQTQAAEDAAARLAVLMPAAESVAVTGWYNGDWQSGIPGLANWFISDEESLRVYDEFVVPDGGWTVAAVFSNNRMDFTGVTHAAWEIRSGMGPGQDGKKVAGGVGRATQKVIPGNGPFARDPLVGYRIQVDGLHVRLASGHYWLSVAPVGMGVSFASATRGRNALGNPPADGRAFFRGTAPGAFEVVETMGVQGQAGVTRHFSLGVLIVPAR